MTHWLPAYNLAGIRISIIFRKGVIYSMSRCKVPRHRIKVPRHCITFKIHNWLSLLTDWACRKRGAMSYIIVVILAKTVISSTEGGYESRSDASLMTRICIPSPPTKTRRSSAERSLVVFLIVFAVETAMLVTSDTLSSK